MTSINFNPASRIGTTPQTPQPRRPVAQDNEERMLIARLFGKPQLPTEPAKSTLAVNNNEPDEFAPSLGRNLDVLA